MQNVAGHWVATVPQVDGSDLCEGSHMPLEADRNTSRNAYPNGEKTLSDEALELVHGPRAEEYAPPEVNMPRIGAVWGAILGREPIPAWQTALMLAGLKLVRAANTPSDDSLIDSVGYMEIVKRLRPSTITGQK